MSLKENKYIDNEKIFYRTTTTIYYTSGKKIMVAYIKGTGRRCIKTKIHQERELKTKKEHYPKTVKLKFKELEEKELPKIIIQKTKVPFSFHLKAMHGTIKEILERKIKELKRSD